MECPICCDDGVDLVTPCHHVFHAKCFFDWHARNPSCPICRHIILPTCFGITKKGRRCANKWNPDYQGYCWRHKDYAIQDQQFFTEPERHVADPEPPIIEPDSPKKRSCILL
uniref:RING-type domain-containing protein n=1 Tax=viral metagenome TaxID=1070528 RepID=A0A6C0BPE1_9ZZZZ